MAVLQAVSGTMAAWYWLIPFAFVIVASLTVIVLEWPVLYHQRQVSLADAERAKAEQRRWRKEWQTLQAEPPAAPQPVIDQIPTPHQRAWRHFLIRCTVEAARVGKLNFRNGLETFFFGNHTYWRAYIDRLVRWDMCWPPSGEGTMWREGKGPALVLDLLSGGQLPPLPQGEYPPSLVEVNNGGVENTSNTGKTPSNSVYASEHKP